MSIIQKYISNKRDVGNTIKNRRLSSNGLSLENKNKIKNLIKKRQYKTKCCGR
jgi:hypothetical protein